MERLQSSSLLRARLTAAAVAEGVGVPSPVIHDSVEAGVPGRWWYTSPDLAFKGYQTEGNSNHNDRYFREGSVPGNLPLGESALVETTLGDGMDVFDAKGELVQECKKKWLGFNYVSVKPASDAAEIWSVSIPKSATIKFFAPLSGIVAEKPEWLPRRKPLARSGNDK